MTKKLFFWIFLAVSSMGMAASAFSQSASFYRDNPDGSRTLLHHVPQEVQNGTATLISHASSSQVLDTRIVLPLSNQSQLTAMLKDLYDPKSPTYHQFLTPDRFAQQFAPDSIDTAQIKEYLQSQGLSVTGQSKNGAILHVSGPVPNFEQAFNLHINNYQKADGTKFFAPDTDPTIPPTLSGKVLAIGGLHNLPIYTPNIHIKSSTVQGAGSLGKSVPQLGTGPLGDLAPNDVMTAYNLTAIPTNGSGQTIALFELDGYLSSDINFYEAYFNLSNIPLTNILIDGFNGQPDDTGGALEVTADIELVSAFAPQNSNILVYEAPNTTQSWIDEWNQITTDDKAKVISVSWGNPEEADSPTLQSDYIIFQQMAAQGQSVFVAAGDSGANNANNFLNTCAYPCTTFPLAVDEPADQPYITGVGISALTINSNGSYNSESASLFGGGGVSQQWTIPSYQLPSALNASPLATVSTSMRNVPDVALTADESTTYDLYVSEYNGWVAVWGSSLSTPIWASFISIVNQGLGQKGQAPLGFVNPSLYQIAQSSSYANDFHEITTGNNGYYLAEAGLNDATGLGSFNGLNLYNDLITNAMSATTPAAPSGLRVSAVSDQSVELSWNASAGASSYSVERSIVNGGPYTTIASTVLNTSYVDSSVSNGSTYFYVVSALNSRGQSPNSGQVQATPVPSGPVAPTGLNATFDDEQATLTWNMSAGAVSYNLKRSTISGGPYTVIAQTSNLVYDDVFPIEEATYYYVVSAVNANNIESPNSAQVQVSPPVGSSQPTNFTATAGNNQVTLSWTAVPGATDYTIFRGTNWANGPTNAFEFITGNTYVDTSAQNGTTYFYFIYAFNANGSNVFTSNVPLVFATPNPPGTTHPPAPAAPTGLTGLPSANWVELLWNGNTGAVSYNVKRSSVSGGPYTTIASLNANTNYLDGPLSIGGTYYYVVSAVNAGGVESPNSAQLKFNVVVAPNAPTGLTGISSNNQVALSWNVTPYASTYNVSRSTVSGGPYTALTSGIANTTYVDTSAKNQTTYYYVVSAANVSAVGPNSEQLQETPVAPPAAPTGLTATAGNNKVSLSWTASTGAATYNLLRSTVSGGPYTVLASGLTSAKYVDISVTNGTTYYYVVSAVNTSGVSPKSAQAQAAPAGSAPVPPVASATETPTSGTFPLTVNFNASASTDPSGGTITSYVWNFGDGTSGSGVTTSHIYQTAGSYTSKLTVTDDRRLNGSYTFPAITVTPPPVASATDTPASGLTPLTVNFNGSASTDTDGTITGYSWNFGDGTTGSGVTTSHVYTKNGAYSPVLTVTDSRGEKGSYYLNDVTVLFLAPTGLFITAGNNYVSLSWSAVSGAMSYDVLRSTVSGGPYTILTSGLTSTNYKDTSALNGTTYYYVVLAVNSGGDSPNSAQVQATPGQPPAAPTGLSATPGSNTVFLQWTASAGAATYNVFRSTVSRGPYTFLQSVTYGTSTSDDTALNGTTYYYVVSAVNSNNDGSPNSAQVQALPDPPPVASATETPALGAAPLTVNFNASASTDSYGTITSYSWFFANGITGSGVTTSHVYTTPGAYTVVLTVKDNYGRSGFAFLPIIIVTPAAPTGLSATAGNNQVSLSWTASSGASSYDVLRSTVSGGPYTVLASGLSGTNYVDTTAQNGTTYYYVVTAVIYDNYQSPNSTQVQATLGQPPLAPTGLSAVSGNNQAKLSWLASTGATSYIVSRSTVSGGPYTVLASGITDTTYLDTGVEDGTTYYYVVQAVNAYGESPNSPQLQVQEFPY